MEEKSAGIRGYLGSIWEAFGRHLEAYRGIWKHRGLSGRHLGSIWEASGRHLGGRGDMEHLGASRGSGTIKVAPLSNGMQKVPKNVDFTMCL